MKIGYKALIEDAEKDIETLDLTAARALLNDPNVVFVDLRDVRELAREGKIPGAFHAPRGMLEFWVDPDSPYHKNVFSSGKRLIFYCQSGWRSALATQTVQRMGLANVCHIGGGFSGWKTAGAPVEMPEKETDPVPRPLTVSLANDSRIVQRWVVGALAFAGGFVIMALELLGGRILAPYFGNSIYVWGSIISVFMLSLALGYLIGGHLSTRNPSLPRFAALFLLGAALTYPLVLYGDALMRWVFERIEDPRYGSLVAAAALFTLPTVVLGMLSPYAVRLVVSDTQHAGRVAGTLYFVSTLGSAVGTLATSFYLVLWFEINTILDLLTACLVACAAIGYVAGRR